MLSHLVPQRRIARRNKPHRAQGIALFHIGRSGSTVLGDLLNQHPQVHWDGEVYLDLFRQRIPAWDQKKNVAAGHLDQHDLLGHLARRMARASTPFYGFEVKFFHLRLANTALPDYIMQLQNCGVGDFIVLQRRNVLRKIVSGVIAREKTRIYHQLPEYGASLNRVHLDVDNVSLDREAKPLLAFLREYEGAFEALSGLLRGERVLSLTYEDHIAADPLTGYRAVLDFVGLDYHEAQVHFGKTNPFALRDMLENFDEVASALAGTEYEWMAHE